MRKPVLPVAGFLFNVELYILSGDGRLNVCIGILLLLKSYNQD